MPGVCSRHEDKFGSFCVLTGSVVLAREMLAVIALKGPSGRKYLLTEQITDLRLTAAPLSKG
jgi:hypothetical protein